MDEHEESFEEFSARYEGAAIPDNGSSELDAVDIDRRFPIEANAPSIRSSTTGLNG